MHLLILIFCVAALFALFVAGLVKLCTPKPKVRVYDESDNYLISCPVCGSYRVRNRQQ